MACGTAAARRDAANDYTLPTMLIPFGIDKPLRRRPIVTEMLVVVNLAVYLLGLAGSAFGWFDLEQFVTLLGFSTTQDQSVVSVLTSPIDNKAWGLITYQFVHDPNGLGHLAFNMLFLWVFGRAVESRFRGGGFLVFYLMSGIIAAFAHASITNGPSLLIGASGSISGVTGAFLALFPRAKVKVLLLFFIIGVFEIPAMFLLALFFALDLLRQTMSLMGSADNSVAYMAHIAGYVFGFSLAFSMLAFKILRREEFDMWYILVQSRRRAQFRRAQQQGSGAVWDTRAAQSPQKRKPAAPELTRDESRVAAARSEINDLLARHELEAASEKYVHHCDTVGSFVLPEARQLDVASQLYASDKPQQAAKAYELFLENYPRSRSVPEVQLLLAVLYARSLNKLKRARQLVESARDGLRDPSQKSLADDLAAELGTA